VAAAQAMRRRGIGQWRAVRMRLEMPGSFAQVSVAFLADMARLKRRFPA